MKATLRQLFRFFVPAPLRSRLTRHRRIRFAGGYASWAEARAAATGYDDAAILEKVAAGARAVKAGRAAFERDSVTFAEPLRDTVMVEALNGAATPGAPLRVLDFGGSLGSSYHQHRGFLAAKSGVQWHVVEQPHFVGLGRHEFETTELRFHDTIASAVAAGTPAVVLAASVLQYLEAPWAILAELAALPANTWIIARTPFAASDRDHVAIQHVPAAIYRASYPAWVLSQAKFETFWTERNGRVTWHPADDGRFKIGDIAFDFQTAVVRR